MAKSKARTTLALILNLIRSGATAAEACHSKDTPLAHQKFSKLVQLPEEILLIIFDGLSLPDRALILQTCRYFRLLLEGILYRHLNQRRSNRAHRLHRTLSERPDLISFINSYRGPLMLYIQPKPTKLGVFERLKLRLQKKQVPALRWDNTPFTESETFRRAIFIFTQAINIREPEFTNGTDCTSNPIWEPVKATILKMSLTRLSLPLLTGSEDIVSLLRGRPELEHLELSTLGGRFEDLRKTDVPKLNSLKATLMNAAAIVPGRPVGEFYHLLEAGEHAPDEHLLQQLSLSTAPITKVTTGPWGHDSVRSSLQVLARCLPEIQHSTLIVRGFISGQLLLAEIPLFRSLRSVEFLNANLLREGHPAAPIYSADEGNEIARQVTVINSWEVLLQRLQEKCPSLVDLKYTPRQLHYPNPFL